MGKADLDRVRNESERVERSSRLIRASASVFSSQGAYTTPEMVALERDNLDLMLAGRRRTHPSRVPTRFRRGPRKGLLADQAEAAKRTLTATDWLTAIEGRAGSSQDHDGRRDSRIRRRARLFGAWFRADHSRRQGAV